MNVSQPKMQTEPQGQVRSNRREEDLPRHRRKVPFEEWRTQEARLGGFGAEELEDEQNDSRQKTGKAAASDQSSEMSANTVAVTSPSCRLQPGALCRSRVTVLSRCLAFLLWSCLLLRELCPFHCSHSMWLPAPNLCPQYRSWQAIVSVHMCWAELKQRCCFVCVGS